MMLKALHLEMEARASLVASYRVLHAAVCLGVFFPFLPQFPHLLHSSFSAQLPGSVWDERRVLWGFDASREALGGDQGHQSPPQAVPRVSEVPPGRAEASWVPAHAEQA